MPLDNTSYINQPFFRDEISKVVCKSKTNKAPGIDGIVYDVLKNELTTDLLTTFFNLCFENHKVPEIWVQALIYPIPKSPTNDPRVPLNYRGISLLSVISKLYTAALNARLNNYTETNGYIVNEQNGFRPDRSCLDHIFVLKNVLRIRNELNTQTFCAFIDFKKAFDLVDWDALLYKLRKIGIAGNFYFTIKALYTNAKSCVQVNDRVTDWFDINTGVRQGDSLSPSLFSILINDLVQEVKDMNAGVMVGEVNLPILLYADDIVLISPTPQKLQSMLDVVGNWCRKWGIQVNAKKTQVLHARNPQRPRSTFEFRCGEAALDYAGTYKYLGYVLHEHLSETKNVEVLTAAASRSFGRIHSIFKSIGNMGIKTYETLYESYVDPIMNYASGVWGFRHNDAPRVLQNRIMRFYLGVHKFAPVAATKLEMDWLECREKRWLNMLRLFNRISIMNPDKLPKIVYDWDRSLGLESWGSEIRHISASLGIDINSNDGDVFSLTDAYNIFLNQNRATWQSEAHRKPKLRTFVQIHDFDSNQLLVKSGLTRYQRSLLSQLKFGILPLKIETDRYQGIPPDRRICKLCDLNTPEDEAHFLFSCPTLTPVRDSAYVYFENSNLNLNSENPNEILVQMCGGQNIENMGKFVECLYKERKKIIYKWITVGRNTPWYNVYIIFECEKTLT